MNALAGWRILTRLALRRDRVSLGMWILVIGGLAAMFTAMSVSSLPSHEDVVQETALFSGTPSMRFLGLPSGASVGGYMLIRGYLTLAVLAALMSIFAVTRATREDEETGRAELLGSAVVGRQARMAAAVTVAALANLAVIAAMTLGLIANGMPAVASLAAGCSVGAVGMVFTGVSALTAQLVASARAANGLAGASLGLACVLSGVGNMAGHVSEDGLAVVSAWPAWLSPVGWGQQMRPFDELRWWPIAASVLALVALVASAGWFGARRDFGLGVIPQRRGRGTASPRTQSLAGLTWRLHRGSTLAWMAATAVFGLILGSLTDSIANLEGAALDWYRTMGGTQDLAEAFRASMIQIVGIAAAVYIVQAMLRLRSEELSGRTELVLASKVTRGRLFAVQLLAATAGATAVIVAFAIGLGLTGGASGTGRLQATWSLVGAGLVQVPVVALVGAVAAALVGWAPRPASAVSWAFVSAAIIGGPLFGAGLGIPAWAQRLSPFTYAPKAPAAPANLTTLLVLSAAAALLAVGGAVALKRRNMALPV